MLLVGVVMAAILAAMHKELLWGVLFAVGLFALWLANVLFEYIHTAVQARIDALKMIQEDQEKTCRNALRAQHRRTV